MANINHDKLFKELLTTFFIEFLDLFFPSVLEYLDTNSITFVDKELFTDLIGGEKKILDVVALTKFQGQDYSFLVHIENQASNQANFERRMFRYFCSLFLKYDRPVYPIVVFSYNSPQRLDKNSFVVDFPDGQILNFNYKIIQLNRLDWRDFLQQKNPVAAALMAKMKISPQDRPQVKAECLRLMVTLKLDPAKMQLISGFIDTYLNLNPDEEQIFQTQLNTMEIKQREQIMEITTSWKEEGRLEGRLEEKLSIALRLLNRKLGTLPQAIADRVKSLESSQLDTLTEDLLDFQTLDDLQIWLRNL
ncbi:MAG: Rpn family recombination-promoting nuclease/putative transposase [Waterburya sp.]